MVDDDVTLILLTKESIMSKKITDIVSNIINYEVLGNTFVITALMNEAHRAIKHYAENGDNSTTVDIIDPKVYALVAENVKQQLEKYLEESK